MRALKVEMRGKSTFELARCVLNGEMRGKSTFELAGCALNGEMRGKSTFELAGCLQGGFVCLGLPKRVSITDSALEEAKLTLINAAPFVDSCTYQACGDTATGI